MTGEKVDDGLCGIRWCDEASAHTGPHRSIELDVLALDVDTVHPTIFQAVRQGGSARVQACVIVCGSRQVALTWPQARELSGVLRRMYASQPDVTP